MTRREIPRAAATLIGRKSTQIRRRRRKTKWTQNLRVQKNNRKKLKTQKTFWTAAQKNLTDWT